MTTAGYVGDELAYNNQPTNHASWWYLHKKKPVHQGRAASSTMHLATHTTTFHRRPGIVEWSATRSRSYGPRGPVQDALTAGPRLLRASTPLGDDFEHRPYHSYPINTSITGVLLNPIRCSAAKRISQPSQNLGQSGGEKQRRSSTQYVKKKGLL